MCTAVATLYVSTYKGVIDIYILRHAMFIVHCVPKKTLLWFRVAQVGC